ncbi:MAG: GerMN domain-containing protein [Christensenellales bacterium]|jgi:spore germination protein GerM
MKRIIAIILAFSLLSGCATQSINGAHFSPLPMPTPQEGEYTDNRAANVTLFFPGRDNTLEAEVREVTLSEGTTLPESALAALIEGPESPSLRRALPEDVTASLELSRNLVNVYFDSGFEEQEHADRLLSHIAVVNTLCAIDGIDYVSVFYNGSELGASSAPLGAMQSYSGDIGVLSLQLAGYASGNAEHRLFVPVYFVDALGKYLLPEIREITVTGGNYAAAIIEELKRGPISSGLLPSIDPDIALLSLTPLALNDDAKFVELSFGSMPGIIRPGGDSEALAYAALAYSLSGIAAPRLRFILGGNPVPRVGDIPLDNGFCTSKDFFEYLGNDITLYYPHAEFPSLITVRRAVHNSEARYFSVRMAQLMSGPSSVDSDAWPIFPGGVTSGDVLNFDISDDILFINLSENFAERCASMDHNDEMLMVYSITNSMTGVRGINRVYFLVEGQPIESIAGHLWYGRPFLRNPGLIYRQ